MKFGMDDATAQRVDDLTTALDHQAEAQNRLAAAIEAHTALLKGSANYGGGR
ncbi:hypothetical protein AVT46_gp42 [Mycobacterium phage MOOREtheMARYer]|uniref:Uncharacterized protein n=1 Tax=Mycobacterium phage MOOREtheMARYer TaxID=1647309 RepID=A0A0F6WEQ2_9CAUD|nr:hypothetical protein AVT46_gp42 [Mycobacterium phage MOOREtheMARYer]AKF14903.1 hypothetical protein SEA_MOORETHEMARYER_42 [Mycobacterium phage MOOREtheMARYer]